MSDEKPMEWTNDQVADALDRLAQAEWPSEEARLLITAAARLRASAPIQPHAEGER